MPLAELLGRVSRMRVLRLAQPGAYVAHAPGDPELLLPAAEVPEGTKVGDELTVFVYLDSEDRPVATTRAPKLEVGEVAFLDVSDVTRIGAFFSWGLPKDLLVPFKEQTRDVALGERHPIGLYVDSTGRLAGTMRVSELLDANEAEFDHDEWVEGEAWRNDPEIGVFVIVERSWVGLVPKSEPNSLTRGQAARFRVSRVRADGKIELSMRGHAHTEREADAERILATLKASQGALRLGDKSSPEDLREAFGLSKKAFKRAVGRLLELRAVRIDEEGFLVPL
jgi:uncharacterized protein